MSSVGKGKVLKDTKKLKKKKKKEKSSRPGGRLKLKGRKLKKGKEIDAKTGKRKMIWKHIKTTSTNTTQKSKEELLNERCKKKGDRYCMV